MGELVGRVGADRRDRLTKDDRQAGHARRMILLDRSPDLFEKRPPAHDDVELARRILSILSEKVEAPPIG